MALVSTPANWLAAMIVVIPGILISARSRGAGSDVVEMPGELQRPGVVQALLGIGPPAQPLSRHRGFLCSVGEDFVLEDQALVIGLGRQRSGGVVDQLEVAFVLRHARGHVRLDVVEHLVGSRLDHVHRAIAYTHRWSLRLRARLILLAEAHAEEVAVRSHSCRRWLPAASPSTRGLHRPRRRCRRSDSRRRRR